MKKLTVLLAVCLLLTACGPAVASTTTAPIVPTGTTAATTTAGSTATSTTTSATTTTATTTQKTEETTVKPPIVLEDIPMPVGAVDVTTLGAKEGKDNASTNATVLGSYLRQAKAGTILYFPKGEYYLSSPISLNGREDIQIVGNQATLIRTGVTNTKAQQDTSSSFFVVNACKNITFKGLIFKYDIPTSISAKIIGKDGGTLTLEVSDGSAITGNEYVTVVNSFNSLGVITKTFEQYASSNFPVEKLTESSLKVSGLNASGVRGLSVGSYVCLRLSTGSNYVFDVYNTSDISFEAVTIRNSLNGGMLVTGRCANVSLKNVIVQPESSSSLMTTNADILHISDMGGTLTVEGCHFEKPGDDCVNVHGMAYKVDSVNGSKATVSAPRFSFSSNWGKAGDTIEFFDADTFASLGTAVIRSTSGKTYTFDQIPAGVKEGTVISNVSMHPSVVIRDTWVENNRARGFLLQTDNVTVENCYFKNTALAAILIAPDLDLWYEMSPARHITIEGNTFENCGGSAAGVIQLSADHDDASKRYSSYIHSDITVVGNTFISNKNKPALYGVCVENLVYENNDFTAYTSGRYVSLNYCNEVKLGETEAQNALLKETNLK